MTSRPGFTAVPPAAAMVKHALRWVLAMAMLAIAGCDIGCDNQIVSSVASPSGTLHAVAFSRDCGATTGFNTQVSIVHGNAAPSSGGNILILDGTVPLELRWASESELRITGLGSARVFKAESSIGGVSAEYGK